MAEAIENSLKDKQHLLVEAGTGSGKSFAYLYPVIYNNALTIISTGTIALQEQLLYQDIPFLLTVTKPFKAVIAKGRNNYLCRQKLWEVERELLITNPLREEFNSMVKEIGKGWDGDFANLPFELSGNLKSDLGGDIEDCFGNRCDFFNNICFFRKARAALANADIIVTNHALYFTDMITGGGILPKHNFIVFDEAHHIEESAIKACTVEVGKYAILQLLQKINKRIAPPPSKITHKLTRLEIELSEWIFKDKKSSYRLYPDKNFDILIKEIIECLQELKKWITTVNTAKLTFDTEIFKDKVSLHQEKIEERLGSLIRRLRFFEENNSMEKEERVNWVEIEERKAYFEPERKKGKGKKSGAYFCLKSAPLFIANTLAEKLWQLKTVICTSATLAIDDDFTYFQQQTGIDSASTAIFSSPFDFKKQSALYLPSNLPEPNNKEYINSCIPVIKDVLNITNGRAFLLFSSYYAMNRTYDLLKDEIEFPFKKQGELPRKLLIEWFKNTPCAVLCATATFREGVDIRGDALSCIIIDRVPFSMPDEPIVQAKIEFMKAHEIDWFKSYMLPEAITRLKQGVGRLIRTKEDKGIIVILDPRIITKYYGAKVLNSLQKCTIIKKIEQAKEFINLL